MNYTTLKTNTDSWFNRESPVDCKTLQALGVYCVIVFIASLASNTRLLFLFIRNKELFTPINLAVFVHTLISLVGTLVQLPIVSINAFMCRFSFDRHVCYIIAFAMHFIGSFSIALVTMLSLLRGFIVGKNYKKEPLKWKHSIIAIAFSMSISFLFSVMPLLGWSRYALEGAFISCSVEWHMKNFNVSSYNITVLLIFFVIPCIIVISSNAKLFLAYRKSRKQFRTCFTSNQTLKFKKSEKKLKIVTACLIISFLIPWSPYACIAMYCVFVNDVNTISPLVTTIAGLFAKSSLLWSSLLFLCTYKEATSVRVLWPVPVDISFSLTNRRSAFSY